MNKKNLIIFLGIIIVLVIALFSYKSFFGGTEKSEESDKAPDLIINNLNEYGIKKSFGEKLELKEPRGIIVIDNNLLVSDTSNNRLVLIDADGNYLREIGKLGSGQLEFVRPRGLTIDKEGNIYVLDSGNTRIQVLNKKFEFIKQISIDELKGKEVNLSDIVVNSSGDIYFSVETITRKDACIYIVSYEGKLNKIGEGLTGHLAIKGDDVYFVSAYEFFDNGNKEGVRSGKGQMLLIRGKEISKTMELPYKYASQGVIISGESMYMISGAFITLDRFDLQGNYKGTIFKGDIREQQGMCFLAMNNNNFYISDSIKNVVYYLEGK